MLLDLNLHLDAFGATLQFAYSYTTRVLCPSGLCRRGQGEDVFKCVALHGAIGG